MLFPKAQVSTEYLLITGFILVIVAILFTYSFISNNQNIVISQTGNALDKMANATDLVYALGPDNTKFIEVIFPAGTILVQDITVCLDGTQGHNQDCSGNGGTKLGGIEMRVDSTIGTTSVSRPTKAEVELDIYGVPPPDPLPDPDERICRHDAEGKCSSAEGFYRIKVYWCDFPTSNKICLEKA